MADEHVWTTCQGARGILEGIYWCAEASASPNPIRESGSTFGMSYCMPVRAISRTECQMITEITEIRHVRQKCREMTEVAQMAYRLFFPKKNHPRILCMALNAGTVNWV